MKTDQLIDALVADRMARRRPPSRSLAAALLAGGLVSLAIFLVEFGPRADLAAAFGTWRFGLKLVLVLLALASAASLCVALARPPGPARAGRRLLPLVAVALLAIAVELSIVPSASWARRLVGSNALICLTVLPTLSVAPLAAILMSLRGAAPASPASAGAVAGLLAASVAAALYAFHCFDDSPLFVVTWYVLAAVPAVGLGALLGHRLLRW